MQPDEVRQRHHAQTDFRVTSFLVQATVLMLVAGDLNRSVDTVVYVFIGALILILGSLLLVFLLMKPMLHLAFIIKPSRPGL